MKLSDFTDGTADTLRNIGDAALRVTSPVIRLGVTGLARAGKTVFITSLIQNLITGGRLPFFDAVAQGRIKRAYLEPQPDDTVPRFDYEAHLDDLTATPPRWPESTRWLSQLRLTLEFEPQGAFSRLLGRRKLHIDIVDYPGEWLLDLPLLQLSFREWSASAIEQAGHESRKKHSLTWLDHISGLDPLGDADEQAAVKSASLFKEYLQACREDERAVSTLPPGRFLMPGDLEGSPALTFSPLALPDDTAAPSGSLWAMMERRFESYKAQIVKPFFRNHFARLDRQIVLVDALAAINGGRKSLDDLEQALTDILRAFRPGASSWLSSILFRRIDRILFAATKADHLHHSSHDALENILSGIMSSAIGRAEFSGAKTKALALAGIRATREATARHNGDTLPCIVGTPLKGERIGKRVFDGMEEFAIFPGDLPETTEAARDTIREAIGTQQPSARTEGANTRFIRFQPPASSGEHDVNRAALPHIRLDRAMNFLFGDKLK